MKRIPGIILPIARRLVNRHHVGHGHPPQIVIADGNFPHQAGQGLKLFVTQIGERRDRGLRQDQHLIGVASEPRHACQKSVVLAHHTLGRPFALDYVETEKTTGFRMESAADVSLACADAVDQTAGIELTMRVRVRRPNDRTFVFKDQHMANFRPRSKHSRTFAPSLDDRDRLRLAQVGERHGVAGMVANHLAGSRGRPGLIEVIARRRLGRVIRKRRQVVGEDVHALVVGVASRDSFIAGAKVASRVVGGRGRVIGRLGFSNPRTPGAMRGIEHPFVAERVAALFPDQRICHAIAFRSGCGAGRRLALACEATSASTPTRVIQVH